MSTNSRSLPNVPGRGSVSFSNLTNPQTFRLDKGNYVLVLSQVDVTNPQSITLTDNTGVVQTFAGHNVFIYTVTSLSANPITLDLVRPPTGGGVDYVALNPAMMNEDVRTGGL